MNRIIFFRLAAGLAALAAGQVAVMGFSSATQCSICSGPNTPQGGIAAEACDGTSQLGIVDVNPAGIAYKPPAAVQCSRPTSGGSLPCTDLRSGCCQSNESGWFMCNIVIQPDCSFVSVCASVCCPSGLADMAQPGQPGCANTSKLLVCMSNSP